MIEYRTGDILQAEAEALVNTVNCVGVMGRGIALQFKNAYPDNFKAYARACRNEEVRPGRMFVYETGKLLHPRWIINFPTKRHWRDKSRMAATRPTSTWNCCPARRTRPNCFCETIGKPNSVLIVWANWSRGLNRPSAWNCRLPCIGS